MGDAADFRALVYWLQMVWDWAVRDGTIYGTQESLEDFLAELGASLIRLGKAFEACEKIHRMEYNLTGTKKNLGVRSLDGIRCSFADISTGCPGRLRGVSDGPYGESGCLPSEYNQWVPDYDMQNAKESIKKFRQLQKKN